MADHSISTPGPVIRSPRRQLWERLVQLHAQLGMEPPRATLTLDELDAEVSRLDALVNEETPRG